MHKHVGGVLNCAHSITVDKICRLSIKAVIATQSHNLIRGEIVRGLLQEEEFI